MRVLSWLSTMLVLIASCRGGDQPASPDGAGGAETSSPASDDWSMAAGAAIAAGQYAVRPDGDTYTATNRAQDLRVVFGADGVGVAPRRGGGAEVGLSLAAWGREGAPSRAAPVAPAEGPCLSDGAVDAFGACLRRLDYVRPGLVEWWENRPRGLEQGFTLAVPPPGEGALVFDLTVTGASVEVEPGGDAVLHAERDLRYAGLAAWDATGRDLPAHMERTPTGIRLVVDDAGATGPITVDPLLTTATWTVEANQINAELGYTVASAGDVDDDGYGDVVVGAPGYDDGSRDEGAVFVYLGSASGPGTAAAWSAEGNQFGAAFGGHAASAGDVNGDGYGDLVVGASLYDGGSIDEGRAFVYLGSASGLAATPAWTAESDQASARFGTSVASAGDVNSDGYGDVLVSAVDYDDPTTDEGRVYLYLGAATGLASTPAWTREGTQTRAYFGHSVASAGDVDGDGYGDVAVAARHYSDGEADEGAVFVYLGSASGLTPIAAWSAQGNQVEANFGFSVASAGDVNGDGYGDLVVGAAQLDAGSPNEGGAYLYLGSAAGLGSTAAWTGEGNQIGASYGAAVASAGDVNGDGYGDVVVGAHSYDAGSTDEGRAFVYFGSASGLATTAAWTAEAGQTSADFGNAVASAGDVNGDGFGDLLVGAAEYDNGSVNEGRAFVYLGSPSGLAVGAGWSAEGDQGSAAFSASVASAGDVNGDGYGDVVVGAPTYDDGSSDEGRAFLFLGSAGGLSSTAAWTAESNQAGAAFGAAVASAGDVDGDGYGDVVVGAPGFDGGSTDEGSAFVYLGSATGLATSAAWTGESDQAGARFGAAVAFAGDVNGDGYGDLLVGAPDYDGGAADEGRAALYYGSAAGPATSAGWTAESDQAGAGFGSALSGAGDVDGDGYSDVVVGVPAFDGGSTDEGRAMVYLGGAAGLAATEAWTAESDQTMAGLGAAVASAGDVNGDGFGDVVVGAPAYDGGSTNEGRALVYLGSATGLGVGAAWWVEADQAGASLGTSVGSAGDVDGDGYGDLLVGAPSYDNGSRDEGRALVYLGSSSGLAAGAAWTAESDQIFAEMGGSASSAGDVNGDGYGDIVVGAPAYDGGSTDEGRAFLYLGNGADGTGPGLSRTAQARQGDGTTPIVAGLASTEADGFDVAMGTARGAWGQARIMLEVEARPLGQPFDATDLTRGADYTSSTLTGVERVEELVGLDPATGYHWRARVRVSPAEGRPQGWGPWMYGGISGNAVGGHVFTADAAWYADVDGDGFGDPGAPGPGGAGYVANARDCDDGNDGTYPGAPERCDGEQNDCAMTGWTSADEDGEVWLESDTGVWTSYTAAWEVGVDGAPATITLPGSGSLWVCDGTWFVSLTASEPGSLSVEGRYGGAVLSAGGAGSVVAVTGASSDLSLTGLTLADGTGSTRPPLGGALRVSAGTVTVTDCILEDSTATYGGGLGVSGGTVTLDHATLRNNTATSGGGWYQAGGTLAANETVVELNTATDGGGGYVSSGTFGGTGLELLDNSATSTGGGLRVNGTATLTSVVVSGNDAANGGGVYYGGSSGTLTLTNPLVEANVATAYGGGAYQGAGTLVCTGTSTGTYGFLANSAGTAGGGVHLPVRTAAFSATTCDFGADASTNNAPTDIVYRTVTYDRGNDATVSCRNGTCR